MTRRILSAASMVMAAALVATPAVYASTASSFHAPVNALFSKSKMVNVSFRNDSDAPVKVTAGAIELTVKPHETTSAKLNIGDRITRTEASATQPAGTVIAVVASQLADSTIVLR